MNIDSITQKFACRFLDHRMGISLHLFPREPLGFMAPSCDPASDDPANVV